MDDLYRKLASVAIMCGLVAAIFDCVSGEPTLEERRRILMAVPDQPSVRPVKDRHLLVFSRAWGYKHSSISYGKVLARALAEKTNAFQVTLSDDAALFEWERLSSFDAVLFNNTNNEIFLPENLNELSLPSQIEAHARDVRLKENLVRFISEGKGLAVIHAGVASFRTWPEFGIIMGARFDNHPWNSGSTIRLNIDDLSHPVCRAFPSARCQVTDEIYQFKEFDRSLLRVLYHIDPTSVDLDSKSGIHRTDRDFALGWIKNYGKGRVFYSALGHQHDIFWNSMIVQHFLDGIQFALGDLKASTDSL